MKIEIPEKVRVVLLVTERVGIPTIVCLVFAYIYFSKLQKVIDIVTDLRTELKVNAEIAKNDREQLKQDIRRISFRRSG